MRNQRWIGLAALLVVALAGCTSFKGGTGDEVMKRRLLLTEGNFRVVKSAVQGRASCWFLLYVQLPSGLSQWLGSLADNRAFGIALCNPDVRERAAADLHANHTMKGAQVLQNVIMEYDTTGFLFLVRRVDLVLTADVIEFVELEEQP